MNALINVSRQTPIEIALQIDENGMTTAKKLYEYLELNQRNYSRWCKMNIIENEFAEDGIDFYSSQMTSEGRGNFSQDFKLSATFAKKLSMTAKNEKGEQAREYFVRAEGKLKNIAIAENDLSPELKMFQIILDTQIKNEMALRQAENKADKAFETSQTIKDTIVKEYDDWRSEMKHLVSVIQRGSNQTYQETYNMLYDALEKRAHCDLSRRIDNGRFRLKESGAKRTTIEAFCRMDVIEADARLKEIFTTIVKEYVIKFSIK